MYAHCHPVIRGGVSLLVINTSISAPRVLMLPSASERFTLDAATLADGTVRLNGSRLELDAHDLSRIPGVQACRRSDVRAGKHYLSGRPGSRKHRLSIKLTFRLPLPVMREAMVRTV